jgi:hypothetical protein
MLYYYISLSNLNNIMSSLLNNVMISKCNICHEYKNTCQKIEYCGDCKVYICKQCIKTWCWLYFIVLFLIGGLFDSILYGIFFISDEEDVRQFEHVHTQPGYYLIFPLYGIILISVVFLCYVYLETPCFHCKKSLS